MDYVPVCYVASVFFISRWPLSLFPSCDLYNPDGTTKGHENLPSTYGHAMKLRAAMTYGFGRHYHRGNHAWSYNSRTREWEGNPSVSDQVARYMVALRKRKACTNVRILCDLTIWPALYPACCRRPLCNELACNYQWHNLQHVFLQSGQWSNSSWGSSNSVQI